MGSSCSRKPPIESKTDECCSECEDEPMDVEGEVHFLICGIDYSCDTVSWAGQKPLDTKYAFDMMNDLADRCRVTTKKTLWNQQCTKDNIAAAIAEVAAGSGPNDFFVFYYTGHGDQLPQEDADEDEGMDQCLCTVDQSGNTDSPDMQARQWIWMRDDEFVEAIIDALGDNDSNILVLVDACHSATICDFNTNSKWVDNQLRAISMSGCEDNQTSAGTGKGGMFSRALTMSIQDIVEENQGESFMVSDVYNRTLDKYQEIKTAAHTQNISIHGCLARPSEMVWPLQPPVGYMSPANTYMREVFLQ
mmetsp:Transcript_82598/g.242375  ORF Transcript_82598/g.242375 Transcript_82598/m.242375 type:complete len:305 (-) Transcript_82598:109-1023(-)